MTLAPGTRLGPYEIVAPLGEGGMGEVYRAFDPRLQRLVALKVLPDGLARDRDSLARFEREARAASALNHPHIVNIYEIAEAGECRYIAMEHIEGLTLRQTPGANELRRLLPILTNVADALAAAHAAGIVHRDLKPENILVTSDGYAKLVDFGLAKLTLGPGIDLNTAPTQRLLTGHGVIMGTVGYMSPEQVEGRDIDHRSDIFSFGCVLYEAATGRRPFDGSSTVDTLHKIIHDDPPALDVNGPADLNRVMRRCLAKNPHERYQSMKEVSIELREISRSITSTAIPSSATPRRPTVWRPAAVGLLIAAALSTLTWMWFHRSTHTTPEPHSTMEIKRLTSNGNSTAAAISQDGKYIAYVVHDGGKKRIRLMQVATAIDVQILEGDDAPLSGLVFSPDGTYLFYLRSLNDVQTLYRVAILGGAPREILSGVGTDPPSFSPDGSQFVFQRFDSASGDDQIVTASADGSGERVVVRRHEQALFSPCWIAANEIAAIESLGVHGARLVVVDLQTGHLRRIGTNVWPEAFVITKSGNDHLLLLGSKSDGSPSQLWLVGTTNGDDHRLTNDVNNYWGMSSTATGDAIVLVQSWMSAGISKLSLEPAAPPVEITPIAEAGDGGEGLAWTSNDGELVFSSWRQGTAQLWTSSSDGRHIAPLSSDRGFYPCSFGKGSLLVHVSLKQEHIGQLAVVDEARNVRYLPLSGESPACSPVDDTVVYSSSNGGLVAFPLPSPAASRQITASRSLRPAFSPDGTRIAYMSWSPAGSFGAVVPLNGGSPRIFTTIKGERGTVIRWSADGNSLLYNQNVDKVGNLWRQPLDGSAPSQLTKFSQDEIFDFSPSHDGLWIALSRGHQASDVVLIKSTR